MNAIDQFLFQLELDHLTCDAPFPPPTPNFATFKPRDDKVIHRHSKQRLQLFTLSQHG